MPYNRPETFPERVHRLEAEKAGLLAALRAYIRLDNSRCKDINLEDDDWLLCRRQAIAAIEQVTE